MGIDFGIDPPHIMLERAMKRGINVKKAKGEELPFEDESFGAVFLLFTLCFVKNPPKVLSETKRVLSKGGGLIVGFINRDSLWGQLYMKKKAEGHLIYRYARFYSVDGVSTMLEKAAMKVEAYSSTLCQPPSENPYKEAVHHELVEGAGFVCILARKTGLGRQDE
ncbi:MAG: class I SAM-dependent methyltransferase [Nitrospirae bacterium]|nr:class I SAM-dependent methyltransferase [Nitrospirota bacterium]